jgi:cbb3-type cytochrome oxidase maturation protein
VSVIFLLIIISILLAGSFLVAFWFALRKNQFDDMTTPAMRILFEDEKTKIK